MLVMQNVEDAFSNQNDFPEFFFPGEPKPDLSPLIN